jgi:small GTP-binding protein
MMSSQLSGNRSTRYRLKIIFGMIIGPKGGFKVCAVGSHSVGKTTVINRYSTGIFSQSPLPTIQSIITQKVAVINGKWIKLNIWDTAGQEKYKSLVPMFLRDVHCVILVFDMTQPESWEVARAFIEDDVRNLDREPLVVVCGNKIDLAIVVDEIEVRRFCEQREIPFFLTSAFSGKGIQAMFDSICKGLLEKYASETEIEVVRASHKGCQC